MTVQTFEVEKVDAALRDTILAARNGFVLLTQKGQPAFVICGLDNEDLIDDLIAANPDFLETIGRARQQKREGKVKTLAEVREQFGK